MQKTASCTSLHDDKSSGHQRQQLADLRIFDTVLSPRDQGLQIIAAQMSSRMLGLAVSALAQAPCGQRYDLGMLVPADLLHIP